MDFYYLFWFGFYVLFTYGVGAGVKIEDNSFTWLTFWLSPLVFPVLLGRVLMKILKNGF
jgi:hypothetical protein